ncbi:MAG: sialic acid synthase [Micromonosporaceae bacterium]
MGKTAREVMFGGRRIGDDTEAYVIAEIGHNHEGDLRRAQQLLRAAAAAGAHGAKLQKRDNRSLFTYRMYQEPYVGRNSYGPTYGKHREALEFGWSEYAELAALAREIGIDFFASAFDMSSVDFLAKLDLPAIKIASADLTNTPLLEYAAGLGKPLIVSTGGAHLDDVRRACEVVLRVNPQLAVLQCTSVYPTPPELANLSVISTLRAEFPDVVVGYSGHDRGPELSWLAYALGARVVEKHFTLDQTRPGSDHHFSLSPEGLTVLVDGLRRAHLALGDPGKRPLAEEAPAMRKMGKKLVAARHLPAGHVLKAADVAIKSPGDGLKPYRLPEVLGRRLRVPLGLDDDIAVDLLDGCHDRC